MPSHATRSGVSPLGRRRRPPAQAEPDRADPPTVTTARAPRAAATRGRVPAPRPPPPVRRPTGPAAHYDAQTALDHHLARLRSTLGASRVSVWVHEATTGTAAPYRQSVCPGADVAEVPALKNPIPVSRSPFVSAVLERCEPVVVRADGRRAADKEAARCGHPPRARRAAGPQRRGGRSAAHRARRGRLSR